MHDASAENESGNQAMSDANRRMQGLADYLLNMAVDAETSAGRTILRRWASEVEAARQRPADSVLAQREPQNRLLRELRLWAYEHRGAYLFPSWDGARVLKYIGEPVDIVGNCSEYVAGINTAAMHITADAAPKAEQVREDGNGA